MNAQASPKQLLQNAEIIYSAAEVEAVVERLATDIAAQLADDEPLVLCVMGGAAVFAGQLLPKLAFPLEFDYVQASRYHNGTSGQHLVWKVAPGENVRGRTVLLLDDILDEGHTLKAIVDWCEEQGAASVHTAVLLDKTLDCAKPIEADFVGLQVANHYLFGYGMDYKGYLRNAAGIYACKDT